MLSALPWIFLFAAQTNRQHWGGLAFLLLGSIGVLWVALNQDALGDQYGILEAGLQYGLAAILLLTVLEMARRAIGWPLPIIAALALLYGLFGQYIPGEFGHPGTPLQSFLGTLTIAEGGIWGKLTAVSVHIVAIFVIFGAVLNAGEAGQGFMNLAAAAAGRLQAGAAKVAVISSALFGSISGSASANIASTGAITIPTMIRLGYPKRLAAAVEAVASSGGQIMPPLMGAGAFVMVELTGVPYTGVMAAAFLPALLFFLAVWVGIDGFAKRETLPPLPEEERPTRAQVLITAGFFLVPFAVLLWGMFAAGYTPQYAAALAILAATLLLFFDHRFTFDLQRGFGRIELALTTSGQQIATIAAIILCASIIIGVLGITGLGIKITSLILSASGGLLWPALLLTAFACLLLGMEVPTTAAYVICVSIAGPALADLGLPLLMAHLFVFWFALLSTITPPVCGAVFIAAGIAKENWLKVAGTAMLLGLGLYLIPLAMVANPILIEFADRPFWALASAAKIGLGLAALSYALIAAKSWLMRIPSILIGIGLLFVGF